MEKYIIQTGENNPILREKSELVDEINPEIINLCEDMLDIMRDNNGVGLAAPQIGVNLRIIATTQRDMKKNKERLLAETVMINPEIIEKSDDCIVREEACLSVPDVFGKVKRSYSIVVEYLDLKGNKQKKKLKGFNAVIVQHEIDHLNGELFTDKLLQNEKPKKI